MVLTALNSNADSIFQTNKMMALERNGFTPLLHPVLKAQYMVIYLCLDELLLDFTAAEIQQEVEDKHAWPKVEKVFKFPCFSTLK